MTALHRPPTLRQVWRVRGRALPLDRPLVMGVLNVTPDSFSDGGRFLSADAAVQHAEMLVRAGADIVDIGGESTRPQGAEPVSADEELARVLPVVREVAARHPRLTISIDTVKAAVAEAALDAGAHIVNDVSGLRLDERVGTVVADREAGLVLMHSRGGVADMATYTHATYGPDIAAEVGAELDQAVERARRAGVPGEAIAIDPGIGFSKRSEHSLVLLRQLDRFTSRGFPVVIGVSRKRFIGEISGVERPDERVHGSIAACIMALARGAHIFRVHDVGATRQALDVACRIANAGDA